MSSDEYVRAQDRALTIYAAVVLLMLLGIAVLIAYCLSLGPLTSPGTERSFGLAVALMSLMGAVLFHVVDRTYRVWPLGRRIHPTPPGPVSPEAQLLAVKVVILVAAAAAIAYVIGGLIA